MTGDGRQNNFVVTVFNETTLLHSAVFHAFKKGNNKVSIPRTVMGLGVYASIRAYRQKVEKSIKVFDILTYFMSFKTLYCTRSEHIFTQSCLHVFRN